MEILFEIIFEIFGEFLFEFLFELLFQFIVAFFPQAAHETTVKKRMLGYGFLGAVIGVASLWLLPTPFAHKSWTRYFNLIVTPILVGYAMERKGRRRRRQGKRSLGFDTFPAAWMFAVLISIIRFAFL